MANVSWYGGPSIRAQRWPLNGAESPAQPLVSGDLSTNPDGFGPVLERYFLGSTGNHLPSLPSVQQLQILCFSAPLLASKAAGLRADVSSSKISCKCSSSRARGMDPTLPHPCGNGYDTEVSA